MNMSHLKKPTLLDQKEIPDVNKETFQKFSNIVYYTHLFVCTMYW